MPSLDMYKRMTGVSVSNGYGKKIDSDNVMEQSWWDDINAQVAYLYDYKHDDYPLQLNELCPQEDSKKIPIDIKYIVSASQTFEKDTVTKHIQLRPSQKCNVPYYEECFKKRYGAIFPVGLFCDIKDSDGVYNRWLVVGLANYNDPQFPTYEVLRCDRVIQYIFENARYNIAAVLRSQNSYNSGLWADYKLEVPEDQQKFILPLNRDTEKIYYNQRLIIDNNVLTEPRAWRISKINRIASNGVAVFTCAQDHFDQNKDYIEKDEDGNVIGMWADYFDSKISPFNPLDPFESKSIKAEIVYSGPKPLLKVGGSYKKFSAKFIDEMTGDEEFIPGEWKFFMDGEDASSLVSITDVNESQIKVKFTGGDDYIGKVMELKYETESKSNPKLDVEIVSL